MQVFEAVKERLLSGAFPSGARIDPNQIAQEHGVSPTPVRNAMNRLVGAGYVLSKPNDGFYAPALTEKGLRELYECSALMLASALSGAPTRHKPHNPIDKINGQTPKEFISYTESLFLYVLALRRNQTFCVLFTSVNMRLRPARFAEAALISGIEAEINKIRLAYNSAKNDELAQRIGAYHRRRMRYVARIVEKVSCNDAEPAIS